MVQYSEVSLSEVLWWRLLTLMGVGAGIAAGMRSLQRAVRSHLYRYANRATYQLAHGLVFIDLILARGGDSGQSPCGISV